MGHLLSCVPIAPLDSILVFFDCELASIDRLLHGMLVSMETLIEHHVVAFSMEGVLAILLLGVGYKEMMRTKGMLGDTLCGARASYVQTALNLH